MLEQTKSLKLTQDLAFKMFFSRNKQTIRSLLKNVLPISEPMLDICILNPEPEDKDYADSDEMGIRLELRIKLGSGENISVGMQVTSHEYLKEKAMFYWAKLYRGEVERRGDDDPVKTVYSVTFVTSSADDEPDDDIIKHFALRSASPPHFKISEGLNIMIIEMSKLPKAHEDLADLKEKWFYFLYHSTTLSEEARKTLSQHEELKMALENLDQLQKDERLCQKVSDRQMLLNKPD